MGELATLILPAMAVPAAMGLWIFANRTKVARAVAGSDGVQQVTIVVRGRYRPSTVVARCGVPLRIMFDRQEDLPCSERVIFSDFQKERWLAPFATTTVQFTPTRSGEFLFTCALGMYQGRLLVQEPGSLAGVARLLAGLGALCRVRREE